MNIKEATKDFETWLAQHITIVREDLDRKHKLMTTSPFIFLRGTFYRWAQTFPECLPELAVSPIVLSIGDLHVENYGTWIDAEGRLVWGVNDFDEAHPLPFTNDLLRLATSVYFAIDEGKLSITMREACAHILRGYLATLRAGGAPFVLEEGNRALRRMARARLKDPREFVAKLDKEAKSSGPVPKSALAALLAALPPLATKPSLFRRQAGVGSLGRQRFLALSDLAGSRIVREAKAVVPSAWIWAHGTPKNSKAEHIYLPEVVAAAKRSHDPFLHLEGEWIVRRLAANCARIELSELPKRPDERELLCAMGAEVANVHLGSPDAIEHVISWLEAADDNWLAYGAKVMVESVTTDYKDWRGKKK